jgi:ubiquitin-protein ligase
VFRCPFGVMAKRVQKEAKEMATDPPPGCSSTIVDDDLFHWRAKISGPEGSPYAGGVFELDIRLPSNYPFAAPKVVFITKVCRMQKYVCVCFVLCTFASNFLKCKVYHPNVSQSTGAICLDILKEEWTPALSISKVLLSIQSFLLEPNKDFHLEPTVGAMFVNSPAEFRAMAADWTKRFATPASTATTTTTTTEKK